MSLHIRPAQAQDAQAAAPLVYSAGPEAFDYMLRTGKKQALDFLRFSFTQGGGYQGWRTHWVVERDEQVVGVGAFYTGRDDLRLTLGLIRQVFTFYSLPAAIGVIRRALELAPLMKPVSADMLYVANLGVAAECRGQGIGAELLRYHMARARELGLPRYALDVATTNPRAQKLYESLGLRMVKEKKFHGDYQRSPVPDSRRLELQLN